MTDSRSVLKQIRLESTNLFNRLHSIQEDAEFVSRVAGAYTSLPLAANLRCGAWYIDPQHQQCLQEYVYFKSTDGHFSQWDFNLRRANLHLLPIISERGGLLLVDSTRRGKRLPDALTKTVPIWCAVLNRAIRLHFPSRNTAWIENSSFFTPPTAVGASEHAQIAQSIDIWAARLLESSFTLIDIAKPLRPLWITPATTSFPNLDQVDFYPVVCISASKLVSDGIELRSSAGFTYVQGSGDDHESWSNGLTPELFFKHKHELLSCPAPALDSLVVDLVQRYAQDIPTDLVTIHSAHSRIAIGSLSDHAPADDGFGYIILKSYPLTESLSASPNMLAFYLPQGKKGQMKFMQDVLPQCFPFARAQLESGRNVAIVDDDRGNDLAVGVGMAILACCCDDSGRYVSNSQQPDVTKQLIMKRLQWIQESRPSANPSRTTIKRVNEFLMSDHGFRAGKPYQ